MHIAKTINTSHEDLIHDVAYDFYGKRMATCSSDQRIKVWDQGNDGNWELTADWKAHTGSVWKICWAHPEFGQVLASCSFDCTVAIWEQEGKKWIKRTNLVDSRSSVKDIAFAPKHMGLKLATCSADGMIRIYEAMDVMNLTHWPLMEEFEGRKGGCSCISWNPSRFHPPMIAVGSLDPSAKIWEYQDASRRWVVVETLVGHSDAVHAVSFAPNLGRTYHLLATASKDNSVKIWRLTPRVDSVTDAATNSSTGQHGGSKFDVQLVANFDDHNAQVWRVEWNVTGTILASSGDDGTVRLWKADYLQSWKCISVVRGTNKLSR